MPRFACLVATEVRDVRAGLQRAHLSDGSRAYALTDLCGRVGVGDELLVNTAAVDLGLGTGGAHVVHANLSWPSLGANGPGRIMKARYLSEQIGVRTVEESRDEPQQPSLPSLAGVRVVLCVLHSHAMAVAAAAHRATGTAPGYVMTDGGALPFVLSDLAAACLERGVIATAVSAGQAFGAPLESVTVASGVAALHERAIDRVIVAPGPGHAGTADALGFSALDLAGHAGVLVALGAQVAIGVRASGVDARARHQGISHHTSTLFSLTPPEVVVPAPIVDAPGTPNSPALPTSGEHDISSQVAQWRRSLGERSKPVVALQIAEALAHCDVQIASMGMPLAHDRLACSWLGASASWLAAGS